MLNYLIQGFLLGLAYVAPIGTQNMFVINTALTEKWQRTMQVTLIIVFFDISLALVCFWGIGLLVDQYLLFKAVVLLFGSIAVMYIGISLALSKPKELNAESSDTSLLTVTVACFAVTWLNPQAIVDGSLLLGGIYATLTSTMVRYFIIGVCLASLIWFTGLSVIVSLLRNKFNTQMLISLNVLCGLIIFIYGVKLGYTFFKLFVFL